MEHWFDDLAKKLASGDASRRSFLSAIAVTLGGAASGAFRRADALAWILPGEAGAAQPQVRTENRGSCTLENDGTESTVHHSVQATFNGKVLTHAAELKLTHPGRSGESPRITSTRTITLGSDSLLRVERDSREGSTQVKVTYGSAFQGIREAAYTTDGKVIDGTIDGRRISPLPIGADPKLLKFADGKTPPAVKLDPNLESALTDILKKAKDDISSCSRVEPGRASASNKGRPARPSNQAKASGWVSAFASKLKALSPLALTLGPARSGFVSSWASHELADAANGPLAMPGIAPDPALPPPTIPQNSDACQSCQNGCATAALICDGAAYGASAACLIAYAFCVAAAQAVCTGTGIICVNNCNSPGTETQPGGACCPVGCPNVNGCCYETQQCSGVANVCCAANVVVCAGACCPPAWTCKEGVCCTPDRPVCKGICCPPGQVCSNEGICCRQLELNTKPVSCGGACCAEGQKCAKPGPNAEDTCCPKEHICGDTCCPEGCVDGKCRPLCLTGVACGASCCAWGCADAATSTCKKPQDCGQGRHACSPEQAGVPMVCCPNGTGCLNGKCCPANTVSCNNKQTGVMGCWPKSECAVIAPPK
jgi:hypothetical protein